MELYKGIRAIDRANTETMIRDIIYNAALFCGLDDVASLIERDALYTSADGTLMAGGSDNQEAVAEARRLVRCANLVISEVATEYVPLITKELATSEDGMILYSALAKNIINVRGITKDGIKQKYSLSSNGIQLPSARYTVEYDYLPSAYKYEQNIDYKTGNINARLLGYGVACEYCIISGLSGDAVMWDRRYKDSLAVCRARGSKKSKARVFV